MLDSKSLLPVLHTGFFLRFYPKPKKGKGLPRPINNPVK